MTKPKTPTKGAIQRARNRASLLTTAAGLLEDANPALAAQVKAEADKAWQWATDADNERCQ